MKHFKFPRRSFPHCVLSLAISNCPFIVSLISLICSFPAMLCPESCCSVPISIAEKRIRLYRRVGRCRSLLCLRLCDCCVVNKLSQADLLSYRAEREKCWLNFWHRPCLANIGMTMTLEMRGAIGDCALQNIVTAHGLLGSACQLICPCIGCLL